MHRHSLIGLHACAAGLSAAKASAPHAHRQQQAQSRYQQSGGLAGARVAAALYFDGQTPNHFDQGYGYGNRYPTDHRDESYSAEGADEAEALGMVSKSTACFCGGLLWVLRCAVQTRDCGKAQAAAHMAGLCAAAGRGGGQCKETARPASTLTLVQAQDLHWHVISCRSCSRHQSSSQWLRPPWPAPKQLQEPCAIVCAGLGCSTISPFRCLCATSLPCRMRQQPLLHHGRWRGAATPCRIALARSCIISSSNRRSCRTSHRPHKHLGHNCRPANMQQAVKQSGVMICSSRAVLSKLQNKSCCATPTPSLEMMRSNR